MRVLPIGLSTIVTVKATFKMLINLKEVKLITEQEFGSIVDQITTIDDAIVSGSININTAPQEILQLLPGMDADKAGAIITRRDSEPEANQQADALAEVGIEGNPFENISQLLEVDGINMDTFRQLAELVTYRSHGFLIEVDGVDNFGKTIASCVGVLDRTGEQIATKYWKQKLGWSMLWRKPHETEQSLYQIGRERTTNGIY